MAARSRASRSAGPAGWCVSPGLPPQAAAPVDPALRALVRPAGPQAPFRRQAHEAAPTLQAPEVAATLLPRQARGVVAQLPVAREALAEAAAEGPPVCRRTRRTRVRPTPTNQVNG